MESHGAGTALLRFVKVEFETYLEYDILAPAEKVRLATPISLRLHPRRHNHLAPFVVFRDLKFHQFIGSGGEGAAAGVE